MPFENWEIKSQRKLTDEVANGNVSGWQKKKNISWSASKPFSFFSYAMICQQYERMTERQWDEQGRRYCQAKVFVSFVGN